MITTALARSLRAAGLGWTPRSGDSFRIDQPDFDGDGDVFTVSEMTIESHEFATGTILGFNGTTEWALDSLAVEHALWLPREDQLRELLRDAFRSLTRVDVPGPVDTPGPVGVSGRYRVLIEEGGRPGVHDADSPANAYAGALLSLLTADTHCV
ncbi:MAG: hypothetical protein R6W83_06655 [Cryobacterium sp.]